MYCPHTQAIKKGFILEEKLHIAPLTYVHGDVVTDPLFRTINNAGGNRGR